MAYRIGVRTSRILLALALLCNAVGAHAENESKNGADITPASYELGNGLKLGDSGFTLGGYSSAQFSDLQDTPSNLALSHASLFIWWENQSGLKFFSELDSEYTLATHYPSNDNDDRALSLERIYFDYSNSDALTWRVGKFLTPIGRWNLIHADPLVWTTSRPLITQNIFPENISGAMADGSFQVADKSIEYNLYGSAGSDIHPDPDQDVFHNVYGLHLTAAVSENTQLGLSYASFTQQNPTENHLQLFGLDLFWARHGYELMSEFAFRQSSQGTDQDAYGGYLQGVMPLFGKLYGVLRLETMHEVDPEHTVRHGVIGLTYRETRALSYKLEYLRSLHNDNSAPNGLMSSVSVLF